MKLKRILAVTLCIGLLGGLLTGCFSEKSETRTITDHTGAEVEIPSELKRIVISSILPLPSVYCFYRGSSEGLVGMHPSSMAAAENSFLTTVYPEIRDIDTSFVKNGQINIEELMALKPDVVFYSATNTEEREMYDNAGIPAVGFATNLSDFNTIETYADWIQLLGDIFGEEEKALELINDGRDVEKEIKEKTNELATADKPRVLILFNYANGKIVTSGKNFFGQYWIDTAGGVNVAQELNGRPEINMEQIYEWNPDMIFITNFSDVIPEDIINNKIEGNNWSEVKAVREGKVYKFPLGMYRWFPPASDTPLSLQWLAKTIQPEVFKDLDIDNKIKEYYKKHYKIELSDEDLQKIYNPSREAAGL